MWVTSLFFIVKLNLSSLLSTPEKDFNAIEKKFYQPLLEKNNIHIAGKIKINEWNSKQDIQIIIDDIMVA